MSKDLSLRIERHHRSVTLSCPCSQDNPWHRGDLAIEPALPGNLRYHEPLPMQIQDHQDPPQPTIVLSLPPIGRASTHHAARLPELARKPSKYGDLEKMLAALLGSITPVSTPTTTAPRKQPNRDVKCACGACGYLTRTARKWLDQVGLPHCPRHGQMVTVTARTSPGGRHRPKIRPEAHPALPGSRQTPPPVARSPSRPGTDIVRPVSKGLKAHVCDFVASNLSLASQPVTPSGSGCRNPCPNLAYPEKTPERNHI